MVTSINVSVNWYEKMSVVVVVVKSDDRVERDATVGMRRNPESREALAVALPEVSKVMKDRMHLYYQGSRRYIAKEVQIDSSVLLLDIACKPR